MSQEYIDRIAVYTVTQVKAFIDQLESNITQRVLSTGPRGIQGPSGATGPTGAQGASGSNGSQGLMGATGPIGATGVRGATGPAGVAGVAGVIGTTGAIGPTGAAGVGGQGATGARGATGAIGATGAVGATGARGITGPAGILTTQRLYNMSDSNISSTPTEGTQIRYSPTLGKWVSRFAYIGLYVQNGKFANFQSEVNLLADASYTTSSKTTAGSTITYVDGSFQPEDSAQNYYVRAYVSLAIVEGSAHVLTLKLKNTVTNTAIGDTVSVLVPAGSGSACIQLLYFGTGVANVAAYLSSDTPVTMIDSAYNVVVGMVVKEM